MVLPAYNILGALDQQFANEKIGLIEQRVQRHFDNLDTFEEMRSVVWPLLAQYQKILPVDFILDMLTHLGHAPNLLFDDDGNWALSSSGMQNVVDGDEQAQDVSIISFVEAAEWQPSIRHAIEHYFNRE